MLVITLVATSAVGLVTGAAAQAAVPPWQQTVTSDPNIAGTLSFYDSAGEQVFGGDTDDPFGYVVGSSAIPSGETKGALFLYRPTSGTAPGAWSGAQLTAAAPFPTTAPGDVPTGHPVVQGQAGDSTVAGFAGAYPSNDSTAGYSGVYELRLRTTRPGATASTAYDVADIKVTGTSWSVSYPFVTSPTSTSVTLGASGAKAGGSVTLTATVTPSTATGVVQFRDNGTALGSPVAVTNGVATATVQLAKAGSRTLTANFAPTGTSHDEASVGTATYSVAKATSALSGTWSTAKPVYGRAYAVKAKVTAAGLTPTGTVRVLFGSTVLASKALASGAATITVPGNKVAPGKRTLTLAYLGSTDVLAKSIPKTVTISKATSSASNTVNPTRITKSKRAKFTVRVAATGVVPIGTIAVYDGSTKLKSATLVASNKGKIVIRLTKLKVGKHSLHAAYLGSATVAASTAGSVKLTVK